MPSSMASRDLSPEFVLAITIVDKLCSISSMTQPASMDGPVEYEEITEPKILRLHSEWKMSGEEDVDHIFGAGAIYHLQFYMYLSDLVFVRSVHNSRIERLWYDFTQGIGGKWHDFFIQLEHTAGLNHDNPTHIWLLQHLFLQSINDEVAEWAKSWNAHVLQLQGERDSSPREMFLFGMLQYGVRGVEYLAEQPQEVLDAENIPGYGVDWEVQNNATLMGHLLDHNPQDWEEENPFQTAFSPEHMSEIIVDAPGAPLTPAQILTLDTLLAQRFNMQSRDMEIRRVMWREALDICRSFYRASN